MASTNPKLPMVARILLGLMFTVFGINFFFPFLPMPKDMPAGAGAFMGALMSTGYIMRLVKATEVICGLLLLGNRFVPLALTLLAPIIINIVGFHTVFEPANTLVIPLVILVLELFLAYSYRAAFAPMLRAKVDAQ